MDKSRGFSVNLVNYPSHYLQQTDTYKTFQIHKHFDKLNLSKKYIMIFKKIMSTMPDLPVATVIGKSHHDLDEIIILKSFPDQNELIPILKFLRLNNIVSGLKFVNPNSFDLYVESSSIGAVLELLKNYLIKLSDEQYKLVFDLINRL